MKHKKFEFKTPVLFLVFNRPDTTKKVFEEIRKAKPKQLFIAADGPRKNNEIDKLNCIKVRDIVNNVDWDCEVKTLFRDENLGCKYAVSGAINWFFENVEEGIILEDDCLPSQSFFRFCQELLEKYRYDERIMCISGINHFPDEKFYYSYFYSIFTGIWGWASWRRAWNYYDVELKNFQKIKTTNLIESLYYSKKMLNHKISILNKVLLNCIDTWDYQWDFAVRINNCLCVKPSNNLVQNIGFGKYATHTRTINHEIINNQKKEISFPLIHPEFLLPHPEKDLQFFEERLIKKSLGKRIKKWLKKIIKQ